MAAMEKPMPENMIVHYDDQLDWLNTVSGFLQDEGFSGISGGTTVQAALEQVTPNTQLIISDNNDGLGEQFVRRARLIAIAAKSIGLANSSVPGVDIHVDKECFSEDFLPAVKRLLG